MCWTRKNVAMRWSFPLQRKRVFSFKIRFFTWLLPWVVERGAQEVPCLFRDLWAGLRSEREQFDPHPEDEENKLHDTRQSISIWIYGRKFVLELVRFKRVKKKDFLLIAKIKRYKIMMRFRQFLVVSIKSYQDKPTGRIFGPVTCLKLKSFICYARFCQRRLKSGWPSCR